MAINPLNNSLIVLPNSASTGQSRVSRAGRVVDQQPQSSETVNSRAKTSGFKNRVENQSVFSKDVIFSRTEKNTTNPSIGQYLITENIAKRDAIQSLVGLDVFV